MNRRIRLLKPRKIRVETRGLLFSTKASRFCARHRWYRASIATFATILSCAFENVLQRSSRTIWSSLKKRRNSVSARYSKPLGPERPLRLMPRVAFCPLKFVPLTRTLFEITNFFPRAPPANIEVDTLCLPRHSSERPWQRRGKKRESCGTQRTAWASKHYSWFFLPKIFPRGKEKK